MKKKVIISLVLCIGILFVFGIEVVIQFLRFKELNFLSTIMIFVSSVSVCLLILILSISGLRIIFRKQNFVKIVLIFSIIFTSSCIVFCFFQILLNITLIKSNVNTKVASLKEVKIDRETYLGTKKQSNSNNESNKFNADGKTSSVSDHISETETIQISLQLLYDSITAQNKFEKEFMQAKINEFFYPSNLAAVSTIQKNKIKISGMITLVNDYESSIQKNYEAAIKSVNLSKLSEEEKKECISILDTQKNNDLPQLTEYYGIIKSILNKYLEMLTFLEGKQGAYIISNGKVLFYNQTDYNSYSNLVQSLTPLVNSEAKWREKANKEINQKNSKNSV